MKIERAGGRGDRRVRWCLKIECALHSRDVLTRATCLRPLRARLPPPPRPARVAALRCARLLPPCIIVAFLSQLISNGVSGMLFSVLWRLIDDRFKKLFP
jgi:hypothetical protein